MYQRNALMSILTLVFLLACSGNQTLLSAPLGDKKALEELADAYRVEAKKLPVSPANIRPEARKAFLQDVFSRAGFSYKKTLLALSVVDKGKVKQSHKDMAQLLSLPHHNINSKSKKEMYSEIELQAIQKIELL